MSGNVGSDISESGMVANVGVAVETALPSLSVQTLFLLPVSWPTINHILPFRGRPMSDNIGSDISESGVVANVGVAVGTASPSLSVQALFLLPVSWPTFRVPDVRQCRKMSAVPYSGRAWLKMWG